MKASLLGKGSKKKRISEKIIQKVILGANCAYIQLIFQNFDTLHEKKTNIVWFVAQQEGRVAHAIPALVPIQVGGLDF